MKVQIWIRDGYGQGSIVKTCESPQEALSFAKKYVSDTNFDNALTPIERRKNWELYLPIINNSYDNLYSGKFANKHTCYDTKENISLGISGFEINLYLGEMSGVNFFVQDEKNKEIKSIDSDYLRNKGFVFFKVLP